MRLRILSLNNNRIEEIDLNGPEGLKRLNVLDQLRNLQELHVEGNYLSEENITQLREHVADRENLTIVFGKQKNGLNVKQGRR